MATTIDEFGTTPLHAAAYDGKVTAFIDALVTFPHMIKADINAQDRDGETPLMALCTNGMDEDINWNKSSPPIRKELDEEEQYRSKSQLMILKHIIHDKDLQLEKMDNKGRTAIDHAQHYSFHAAAKLIKEEINARNLFNRYLSTLQR